MRGLAELPRGSRPFRDYPPPDIVYYGALRKANIAKHVSEDHEKKGEDNAWQDSTDEGDKENMLAEDGDAETREARELSYASGELFKALDTDGSGELSRRNGKWCASTGARRA